MKLLINMITILSLLTIISCANVWIKPEKIWLTARAPEKYTSSLSSKEVAMCITDKWLITPAVSVPPDFYPVDLIREKSAYYVHVKAVGIPLLLVEIKHEETGSSTSFWSAPSPGQSYRRFSEAVKDCQNDNN